MGSHRLPAPVLLILLCVAAPAAADDAGRSLFLRHCATCHGVEGDGQGPTGRLLGINPRDFTAGLFRLRSTPAGTQLTEDDLVRTLSRGLPGTRMPSWKGVLTEPQLRAIAGYVRQLGPKDLAPAEPGSAVVVPSAPEPTPESIARGRSIFRLVQCWQCHGIRGEGDGPSAAALADDKGEPIRPANFTRGILKSGDGAEDVYRTLMTGFEGSPMPSFKDSLNLTRESFDDLSGITPLISAEDAQELQTFIATLPTGPDFEKLPDAAKEAKVIGWRWDVVHYIRSLGQRSAVERFLLDDPYLTP